jgi:hypothetical protein
MTRSHVATSGLRRSPEDKPRQHNGTTDCINYSMIIMDFMIGCIRNMLRTARLMKTGAFVVTFWGLVISSLAQNQITLSAGNVSGDLSFTHGTSSAHSVMAFGPNALMTLQGPISIDGVNDFGMLAIEANWLDGNGKLYDEFYFTTRGNLRVLGAGRNLTDGTASVGAKGYFQVDGSQPGMRNLSNESTVDIIDDQSSFASINVQNINQQSAGAQIILGARYFSDAHGWSLQHDPAQNGSQAFAILNRSSYTFPFQIDAANHISIGFAQRHTATKSLEFGDPKAAREGLKIYSKYRTSDLSRKNVSASADSDLNITLEPGIWKLSADLFFTVDGGTPGFWAYFDVGNGNGSTGWCRWTFPDSTNGSTVDTYTYKMLGINTGAYQSIGPATGTGGYFVKGEAIITVTSTASLQLVWGQWSPQPTTTTLLAPSCVVATKID